MLWTCPGLVDTELREDYNPRNEVFMTRKHYSIEFKQEAVRLALSGAKSKIQTARDLGVPESKLYAWIRQFGPDAPPMAAVAEQAELVRLRKALARAEMERDILKKAIGIFSEAQR
jgi:transposase